MYTLMRSISVRQLLGTQAPVIIASIVIAELFYKFHSFTLESIAFLATWFVLDLVVSRVAAGLRAGRAGPGSNTPS